MQLTIKDYGDEDSALYAVEDEKGNVYFSTRSWTEAENYLAEVEAHDRMPDPETELNETSPEPESLGGRLAEWA